MSFTAEIERHRTALLSLIAMLIAGAGFEPDKSAVLTRMLRAALLYSLRPVEAATRRLVVLRAHLLTKAGYTPKARASRGAPAKRIPRGDGPRVQPFALFDPRLRLGGSGKRKYAEHMPRMSFFDGSDPVFEAQTAETKSNPDDRQDATSLYNRLLTTKAALEDVSKQAKRLLRAQARREKTGKRRTEPLRRGRPPGHRARGTHEVDRILRACHQLAFEAVDAPDTG